MIIFGLKTKEKKKKKRHIAIKTYTVIPRNSPPPTAVKSSNFSPSMTFLSNTPTISFLQCRLKFLTIKLREFNWLFFSFKVPTTSVDLKSPGTKVQLSKEEKKKCRKLANRLYSSSLLFFLAPLFIRLVQQHWLQLSLNILQNF